MRLAFPFLAAAAALFSQGNADWHRELPGFKIAGNLYYVGTADLAVYLINTPQGNILINTDYKQDLPAIKKSIAQLGFKYGDTKILLISHAHGDHDEATALVARETGAKLMVMDADVAEEESTAPGRPGAHVDRVLHDGDTVELGGSTLVAHLTPGHTKGCTTWTMQVRDGARTLNAVIVGSPNVNPGYILVGNKTYPRHRRRLRQDLRRAEEPALRPVSRRARRLFRLVGEIQHVRQDAGRRGRTPSSTPKATKPTSRSVRLRSERSGTGRSNTRARPRHDASRDLCVKLSVLNSKRKAPPAPLKYFP